jgi:hypothetical protein
VSTRQILIYEWLGSILADVVVVLHSCAAVRRPALDAYTLIIHAMDSASTLRIGPPYRMGMGTALAPPPDGFTKQGKIKRGQPQKDFLMILVRPEKVSWYYHGCLLERRNTVIKYSRWHRRRVV